MNKILVIDDHQDNLITVKAVIKSHMSNNEVLTALSGAEGLKLARLEQPDVILLDIIMPGMDGYEVCHFLKNNIETQRIPIIMITAIKTDSASRIRALDLGADAFISKPIDPAELVAEIKVALRIKRSEDLLRQEKMNIKQTVKERTAEVWAANKKLTLEIEERKRTEIKLVESQKQHKTILQTAMDGFWIIDMQGNFLEVNHTYSHMSGYSIQELLKMSISDVEVLESAADIIDHIQKLVDIGEDRFDSKHRRKDGSIFDVEISVQLQPGMGNRLVVFLKDVTERKATEAKIQKSEAEYRSIFEKAPIGIALVDSNTGKFIEVNKAFSNIAGWPIKSLVQKSWMSITHPEDIKKDVLKMDLLNAGEITGYTINKRYIKKNNDLVWIQLTVALKDEKYSGQSHHLAMIEDITDRIKAENKVRESEERYKNFISQVSEGVYRFEFDEPMPITMPVEEQIDYVYNHMFIAECNKAFMQMYGIEKHSDIIGKSQKELHGGSQKSINRDALRKFITEGYRTEDVETEEPDIHGKLHIFSNNSIGIVKNGFLVRMWGTQMDITARKITENELRKLSRAVEQSPVSVVITDLKGNIEYVNQNFVELTGYSSEEVVGKNPRILQSGEMSKEEYKKMWDAINKGKSWIGEFHNKNKNGELYWENALISPIVDSKGNMKHFLAIKEDITEKKQMTENLIDALAKAKESDRLKSAFLATMSHELRTPLNAINGFSEMLIDETDLKNVASFGKIINSSGVHLLSIIEDLFDVTLIESGQVQLTKTEVNLNSLFEDLYKIIKIEQKQLNKTHIDIQYISDQKKNLVINSDEGKLRQVLINLLKNALKFTEEGSIKFGFSVLNNNGVQAINLFVEDSGIGIPEEKKSIIFDAFRQADDSHTRKYGGVGLGLSITKKLVEILGSKIELVSEVGKGSIFSFVLPGSDFVKPEELNIAKSGGRLLNKSKILVAEDDEASFMLVEIYLTEIDSEILRAKNGKEAVEIYKNNTDIALILMDVNMPIMNGLNATKEIKLHNPDLPIVAQTAYAISGDKEKMLNAGCDDYISKPINKKLLFELIHKHVKN